MTGENHNNRKPVIGIVLCGGVARGLAHIGVLKAMEVYGIPPKLIAGSSAGAIVGSMSASGIKPNEMVQIVKETRLYKLIRFPYRGLLNLNYLKKILKKHIPHNSFEGLNKKLYISVSNLTTGENEIISSGDHLVETIVASSSIPLLFKPVEINGHYYVDGGMLNNLPIEPLKEKCDFIIGVNITAHNEPRLRIEKARDVIDRCLDLILWGNSKDNLDQCDFAIDMKQVFEYSYTDFSKWKDIAFAGYKAAMEAMPEIMKLIDKKTQELNGVLKDTSGNPK